MGSLPYGCSKFALIVTSGPYTNNCLSSGERFGANGFLIFVKNYFSILTLSFTSRGPNAIPKRAFMAFI
jgi:hypothetical protein